MEGAGEGTFEHTLIIADEGSDVNYIEGCTAQTYSVNSMHSAVVEIFVHEGAKARYTTVQNWSKDVYNLNTKRARVDAHGTVEWVGGSMGAKYVMLYPGSFLLGEGARADHLNVGVAGKACTRTPARRSSTSRRTRPRTSSPSRSPRTAGSWATAGSCGWARTRRARRRASSATG